ncbi:MAG: hypothetical protein B7Z33_10180 [Sphingomonadales bacterium 12-68-11]|nr:MAG: hypothetical protein B7Z33_10180 [Sphingomonadales bacterium 12-68-11]
MPGYLMTPDAQSMGEMHGPSAQALAWLVRLHSGEATREDLAAFGAWRGSDAANEAAYRETLSTWRLLGPALAPEPVVEFAMPPGAAPIAATQLSRRRLLTGAGLALAAVVAAPLALGVSSVPAGATVLVTRKGERRREVLPDGVVLELNTNTRLVSWITNGRRELRLERGEALVSVGAERGQPLRAVADETVILADRARFLLSWYGGAEARVLCLWGLIDVRANGLAHRLVAGQAVDAANGAVLREPPAQVASVLEWRRGVLAFEGRPAGDVIAELNRYREGRVFLPAAQSDVAISGVIHLDRADAAVDHIARSLGMDVTRLPGGIAILRK